MLRKGWVNTGPWIHRAQAIRAYQPHRSAPQLPMDLTFELDTFSAALLETCRDDDGRAHTGIDTFADDGGYSRRRGHNHPLIPKVTENGNSCGKRLGPYTFFVSDDGK